MPPLDATASLELNGTCVGAIAFHHADGAWLFGDFTPEEAFTRFAPLFGRWSLLMHADGEEILSSAAIEELRETETRMDSVHARLFFHKDQRWVRVMQLSIDGPLIECKIG